MKNKYCELNDLTNEADVETFLLLPLFKDLGFKTRNIKPKHSLDELSVKSLGSRRATKYKPDFAIKIGTELVLIVEAKAPKENLEDHVLQARDYSITLNGAYTNKDPVRYFVLSNGHLTNIYKVGVNAPILQIKFKDLVVTSNKFKQLLALLHIDVLSLRTYQQSDEDSLELTKAPLKDIWSMSTILTAQRQLFWPVEAGNEMNGLLG